MTRASLREYAAVQRARDLQGTRAEKRQRLDEVVAVTGIHGSARTISMAEELVGETRMGMKTPPRVGTAPLLP